VHKLYLIKHMKPHPAQHMYILRVTQLRMSISTRANFDHPEIDRGFLIIYATRFPKDYIIDVADRRS
jgi:hypothetical protein